MLEDQTLAKKYTVRVAIFGAAFFVFFAAFYIWGALRDQAIPIWTLDTLATLSFSAYGSLVFASLITFLSLRGLKERFELALKTCILGGCLLRYREAFGALPSQIPKASLAC